MRTVLMSKDRHLTEVEVNLQPDDNDIVRYRGRYFIFKQMAHDEHGNKTVPLFREADVVDATESQCSY